MRRGAKDHRVPGGHNAICDVCGFKFKASELRLRWDNLRVCADDMEQRHPQDLIKGITDNQAPPWSRPQTELQFRAMAPSDGSKL